MAEEDIQRPATVQDLRFLETSLNDSIAEINSKPGLGHYIGKTINTAFETTLALGVLGTGVGVAAWMVASCFYGPIDTLRVGYGTLFDETVKQQDLDQTMGNYMKAFNIDDMRKSDRLGFYRMLGAPIIDGKEPTIDQINWSTMLDINEELMDVSSEISDLPVSPPYRKD